MSSASASVTSSKRAAQEKQAADLMLELDAIKSLNSSLETYLNQLRGFKKNLAAVDDNFNQLYKVNTQWIDTLNNMK